MCKSGDRSNHGVYPPDFLSSSKPCQLLAGAVFLVYIFIALPCLHAQEASKQNTAPDNNPRDLPKSHEIADVNLQVLPAAADLSLSEAGRKKGEALALYFKGLMFEDAVDMPEALTCFQEVIKLDPGNLELTLEAANLGAAYGKFDEAVKMLEHSLKLNPNSPDAYTNLSQFCDTFHNGRHDFDERAVRHGRQAFERFPTVPDVCEHFADLLISRGKLTEAGAALETSLNVTTNNPYYWLHMGRIARKVWGRDAENLPKVNALYEKALALDPMHVELLRQVGNYYSLSRQYPLARKLYEEIVRKYPEELLIREQLIRVYRHMGDKQLAMDSLQELVAINPHREKTQELLAEMLEETGNPADAIASLEKLLKIRDGEEREYHKLFTLLSKSNRHEEALKIAQRGIRQFPRSETLSDDIVRALSLLERYKEALVQWKISEQLALAHGEEGVSAEFYYHYGVTADQADEKDQAASLFRKSIAMATKEDDDECAADALNHLGFMWLEQGINLDEAGLLIQRAIQFMPENASYADSFGWYFFKKGDYDKALEQLLEAATLHGEPDAEIFDHISQTYAKLGKETEARDYLKRAIDADPQNEHLKSRLAEITSNS
jgi:tetratricopeptide (TPR) repeat protein